jgi:radical SAM-linked protein
MALDKLRFRFCKSGDLRFLGHHDLMRAVERLLRRASIPFHSTNGFNPRPRVIFPLSLPLGVVGWSEVMELELTEPQDCHATLEKIRHHSPQGLDFTSVRRIPSSLSGQVISAEYRLPIPPHRAEAVASQCQKLMAASSICVERPQPQNKTVDIRPYILQVRVGPHTLPQDTAPPRDYLILNVRVTPTGSARAQEIIRWLGAADLVEAGSILERTNLVLLDEVPNSGETTGSAAAPDAPTRVDFSTSERHLPSVAGWPTKDAP